MCILETAISQAGGVTQLAKNLGVAQNVVSNWKARGLPKPWQLVLEMRVSQQAKADLAAPITQEQGAA